MKPLESIADLDAALEMSSDCPVFLFKHSTSCPISSFAHGEYKQFAQAEQGGSINFTYLDLLSHRDVSSAIAEKTGVKHESPQAILLIDGEPVWHASHTGITADQLADAVKKYCG